MSRPRSANTSGSGLRAVPDAQQLPPHDLEAERTVLGSCIAYPELIDGAGLASDDFYSNSNGRIWSALVAMREAGSVVDPQHLRSVLSDQGLLQPVGGDEYLMRLTDGEVTRSPQFRRLRELAISRESAAAADAYARALRAHIGVDTARAALKRAEQRREDLRSGTGVSPVDVIERWQKEGPRERALTGIRALDDACGGGVLLPRRVFVVGAPSAGKTYLCMTMAETMARAGLHVGILAVDEDEDDVTVRLAQLVGSSLSDIEARSQNALHDAAVQLHERRIRIYGPGCTIEGAAHDLAARARAEDRRAALFIDSLQTVHSEVAELASNTREFVEANVNAVRRVATHHGMLVVCTSEANRNWYRDDDSASTASPMAAGAESRAIEFGAETQLVLRTPTGHPDVVHCTIAKNRRAQRGEFWLRLDREKHAHSECGDPRKDPAAAAAREAQERESRTARVLRDVDELAKVLTKHPEGLGTKRLRAAMKLALGSCGVERLEAALEMLERGHLGVRAVDRGRPNRPRWCLEAVG